jgi:hypothetical protein
MMEEKMSIHVDVSHNHPDSEVFRRFNFTWLRVLEALHTMI